MRSKIAAAACLFALAAIATAQEQPVNPLDNLTPERREVLGEFIHLYQSSGFGMPRGEAFEAKFSFSLNNLKGAHQEDGTIEVTRDLAGREHWHLHTPSVDVASDSPLAEYQQAFGRTTYLANKMVKMFTRPVVDGRAEDIQGWSRSDEAVNEAMVHCERVTGEDSHASVGAQTYCLDDQQRLVLIKATDGMVAERSNFRRYGIWQIPQDVVVRYGKIEAMHAHLDEVHAQKDAGAVPPLHGGTSATIVSNVMAGMLVKKKEPKYPVLERMAKIEGTVVLCGLINEQGRLSKLEAVAAPDELLAKSALEAVAKWEYKPYMVDGKPTSVETQILVNYALNKK